MPDRPPGRVGILISGTGSNMLALVRAMREDPKKLAEPAIVISNTRRAKGIASAAELGIETRVIPHRRYDSREEHERAIVEELERQRVELVCLAGYMRLLSPVLVEAFEGRMLNIHPALLPAFPGLHGQRQALEYGTKIAGCTVHFVDEECDHGPIVLQAAVPVHEGDDEDSLAARILQQEHRIYPEAVRLFFERRLVVHGRRVEILEPSVP